MFDIGGWEVFVILAIALIVVGPKDLPVLIRNVGRWVGKARGMAREFQSGINEVAREHDLDEVRKAADVGSTMRDETRKLGQAVQGDPQTNAASRAAGASRPAATSGAADSRPQSDRPGEARRAEDWRDSDRAAPARGVNGERRPAGRDVGGGQTLSADDDELLAGFQHGTRRGD